MTRQPRMRPGADGRPATTRRDQLLERRCRIPDDRLVDPGSAERNRSRRRGRRHDRWRRRRRFIVGRRGRRSRRLPWRGNADRRRRRRQYAGAEIVRHHRISPDRDQTYGRFHHRSQLRERRRHRARRPRSAITGSSGANSLARRLGRRHDRRRRRRGHDQRRRRQRHRLLPRNRNLDRRRRAAPTRWSWSRSGGVPTSISRSPRGPTRRSATVTNVFNFQNVDATILATGIDRHRLGRRQHDPRPGRRRHHRRRRRRRLDQRRRRRRLRPLSRHGSLDRRRRRRQYAGSRRGRIAINLALRGPTRRPATPPSSPTSERRRARR